MKIQIQIQIQMKIQMKIQMQIQIQIHKSMSHRTTSRAQALSKIHAHFTSSTSSTIVLVQ